MKMSKSTTDTRLHPPCTFCSLLDSSSLPCSFSVTPASLSVTHTLSLIPLLSTAHLQQLPTGHGVICKHCSSQTQHSYNRRLFGLLMYHYWNTVTTVRHETAVQSDISTQSQFTSFTYRKERFNPFINESADKQEQISAKQVQLLCI